MFQEMLRRLRLGTITRRGPPATLPGQAFSRRKKLGRCSAEQRKYYQFYLHSGKLTLAAMYLRRVRVVGLCLRGGVDACFSSRYAACACGSTPRRGPPLALPVGRRVAACLGRCRALPLRSPPRHVERPHIRFYMLFEGTVLKGRRDASNKAVRSQKFQFSLEQEF
jgi:hypothetical protein